MIEKTYRCDLCREAFDTKNLIGIHWAHCASLRRDAIEVLSVTAAEHHLCAFCVRDIQAIAEDWEHYFLVVKRPEEVLS